MMRQLMRKMEGKVGEIHSQKSHFTTWPAKRDKWSFKLKSFEFSRQKSDSTFLAMFHPCVKKLTFDYFWEWHFVEKPEKRKKENNFDRNKPGKYLQKPGNWRQKVDISKCWKHTPAFSIVNWWWFNSRYLQLICDSSHARGPEVVRICGNLLAF